MDIFALVVASVALGIALHTRYRQLEASKAASLEYETLHDRIDDLDPITLPSPRAACETILPPAMDNWS